MEGKDDVNRALSPLRLIESLAELLTGFWAWDVSPKNIRKDFFLISTVLLSSV